MKVVSWNLRNISANKLTKNFQPLFRGFGLGNTVLDYIVNVVMGNDQWDEVVSLVPADLFVVIELKTGGSAKGAAVSGNCIPTLNALTNAMNTAVVALNHNPLEYLFAYVTPVVTGRHETVGFIYNTRALTPTAPTAVVERDTVTNTYLPGRTPLVASFDVVGKPATTLRFSAIHDLPPRGSLAVRMRPPIDYCRRLVNTPSAGVQNTFFLGDFNCQPTDNYVNGTGAQVYPFANLMPPFATDLPNDSLSSVRRTWAAGNAGNKAYLSAAYDNALYRTAANVIFDDEYVPDLIGEAKDQTFDPPTPLCPARGRATLNAYNTVSDHLPVIVDLNVL